MDRQEPFEPDSRWQIRKPRTIDRTRDYLEGLMLFARDYADQPMDKKAMTAQRAMIRRAVELAKRCGKTVEVGWDLAKLAHRAATGRDPDGDEWGRYDATHARMSGGRILP